MNQSESIKELATALAKAQGKISHAAKENRNQHFNSKYADLASVLDACREPLSENGLSVCQLPSKSDGAWVLITRLIHSSGEWIQGEAPILSSKQDAQGFGSGMTYARRYGLASVVGIAQDDDDGNAASRPTQQKDAMPNKPVKKNDAPVGQQEVAALFDLTAKKGLRNDDLKGMMKGLYGIESSKEMRVWQYQELTALISTKTLDQIGQEIVTRQAEYNDKRKV